MDSLLVRKDCPVGVDVVIDKLQSDLYRYLVVTAGWRSYKSYHRAYKNKKGDNLLPEVYTEKGEYKEVLFDDVYAVSSFFVVDDKRTFDYKNNTYTHGAAIIFQANLKKLFPASVHRADEEMIDNIRVGIKKKFWENRMRDIATGIDEVYRSLKLDYKKQYEDISYFAIARINFELIYTNTDKTTDIK